MKDFEDLGIHCGVDEVGRGAWSGPVVAAAVRFDKGHNIKGLADSKTLSSSQRTKLYFEIIETFPVGVSFNSAKAIDSLNILSSSLHVMQEAVKKVANTKDSLYLMEIFTQKFQILRKSLQHYQRDNKIAAAAASIVAKVSRDFYMKSLNLRPGMNGIRM